MSENLTDTELRDRAWGILRAHLSPVDVVRFLSMMRRQPRDYQKWRDQHFSRLSADELIAAVSPSGPDAGSRSAPR